MPGSGKTTLGQRLAMEHALPFVDLDRYMELQMRKSIKDIFAAHGEEGFRALERNYLLQLIEEPRKQIIALGGGTPCYLNNMQAIKLTGLTVYLLTPLPTLVQRLLPVLDNRPLLKGKSTPELTNYLWELLKQREPYYLQANIKWDGEGPLPDKVVKWMER